MAIQTTTFKGARYIVKFHDPIEWADTESYEAIEAVQHEAFTYISKQPVPAGVQIGNTDFWLLWADPNAQMEELRQLVSGYVDNVTALDTLVDAINDALPIADFDSVNTVSKAITFDVSKARVFDTVSDMKASNTLAVGMICHTNGFHTSGDGGSAWYEIADTGTANEMDVIACGELFAVLVSDKSNPCCYGADANGNIDSAAQIQRCINANKGGSVKFPNKGVFIVSDKIDTPASYIKRVDIDFGHSIIEPIANMSYVLGIGMDTTDGFPSDITHPSYIENFNITDTAEHAENGIVVKGFFRNLNLSDGEIHGISKGIVFGYDNNNSFPADAFIDNVNIYYDQSYDIDSFGLKMNASDCVISNCFIEGFYNYVINTYGTNFYKNIHGVYLEPNYISGTPTQAYLEIAENGALFRTLSAINIEGCYADGIGCLLKPVITDSGTNQIMKIDVINSLAYAPFPMDYNFLDLSECTYFGYMYNFNFNNCYMAYGQGPRENDYLSSVKMPSSSYDTRSVMAGMNFEQCAVTPLNHTQDFATCDLFKMNMAHSIMNTVTPGSASIPASTDDPLFIFGLVIPNTTNLDGVHVNVELQENTLTPIIARLMGRITASGGAYQSSNLRLFTFGGNSLININMYSMFKYDEIADCYYMYVFARSKTTSSIANRWNIVNVGCRNCFPVNNAPAQTGGSNSFRFHPAILATDNYTQITEANLL